MLWKKARAGDNNLIKLPRARLLATFIVCQVIALLFLLPHPESNSLNDNLLNDISTISVHSPEKTPHTRSDPKNTGVVRVFKTKLPPHDEEEKLRNSGKMQKSKAKLPSHEEETPNKKQMQEFEAKLPLIGSQSRNRRYLSCTPSRRCLVHLHIGKNGGTSLDSIGVKLGNGKQFIGMKHFDWSYIQGNIGIDNVDVILMLRDPVSRSLSHFYFTQLVFGSKKMRAATLTSYLKDAQFLLEERGIWQDGQASVSWLTGTHIANWCSVPASQVPLREELSKPSPELLHLAANRLEQTIWFGILEDVPRSMELMQHALGLKSRPQLPHSNQGKKKANAPPTAEERKLLEYLTPMDRWLYQYGLALFDARWDAYQKNLTEVILPKRPPYPEIPCWSTRFELHCDRGPLKGNFTWTL